MSSEWTDGVEFRYQPLSRTRTALLIAISVALFVVATVYGLHKDVPSCVDQPTTAAARTACANTQGTGQ